jgi:dTDP-4-dehydrorhamnose reductase
MSDTYLSPKILLLGQDGQLGHALKVSMASLGSVTAVGRQALDLENLCKGSDALDRLIDQVKPRIIINAMAYTAVDRAEQEIDRAMAVNALAPGLLASAAQACGACLVHYSTDYVFDGTQSQPYKETDATHPLSVYGQSKYDGEQAVAKYCAQHFIFRTSWVYGAFGQNFLKTMLRLAAERDTLSVVNDQWGAPTGVELIAAVTAIALAQQLGLKPPLNLAQKSGVVRVPSINESQSIHNAQAKVAHWGLYHLVAAGQTNWFEYAEFAIEQARQLGWPLKLSPQAIKGISAQEYPVAATRPQNSRLDTQHLSEVFGLILPDWRKGVISAISELHADKATPPTQA